MTDFNYMQKAVDLDHRLEVAMESFKPEPTKIAMSGLQNFVSRSSIAEEIDALKKQATDLNHERAKEMLDAIVEQRGSNFDAFNEAVKAASQEHLAEAAKVAEVSDHIEQLKGMR